MEKTEKQKSLDKIYFEIIEMQKKYKPAFIFDACIQFCGDYLAEVARRDRDTAKRYASAVRKKFNEATGGIFLIG